MATINYPSWWPGAGIDAKANWLVEAHHCKSYKAACIFLSSLRRKRVTSQPTPAQFQARMAAMKIE